MNDIYRRAPSGFTLWYVAGKGDWKHKRSWLCETRCWSNNSTNQHAIGICRRCSAGKHGTHWADFLHFHGWYDDDSAVDSAIGTIPLLG